MAQRRDVFQSKVLHKLYPKAAPQEVQPDPVKVIMTLGRKPALKRNTFQNAVKDDGEPLAGSSAPGRRVYTALPPPADHQAGPRGASITSGGEAGESSDDTDQDPPECDDHRPRRRRRRGRKRPAPERETGAVDQDLPGGARASGLGAGARASGLGAGAAGPLSKNRRRKLKKKRHREKLHALGLVPPASALEFTFQRAAGEEEEQEGEGQDGPSTEEPSDLPRSSVD